MARAGLRIGVVGATGTLGTELLELLDLASLRVSEIVPIATLYVPQPTRRISRPGKPATVCLGIDRKWLVNGRIQPAQYETWRPRRA